jgi:hypothetical protein
MNLIDMPHFHDPKRPSMSMRDRAGQFMPFKSLKGFDDEIDEKTETILSQEWEKIIDDEYCDLDYSQDDGDDVWIDEGR